MSGPVIAVKFRAGQAEFFEDLTKIKVGVRQFGSEMEGAGHAGVSGFQATSATLRVMEGGLTNNLRAAERFASSVLGLGPLLQAAFPLVGGLAFVGLLDVMGEKVVKFYTELRDGPEKAHGAFEDLNSSLRLSNDELDLSNAKLENEIAKLEGKHENTLKVALEEAKVSADNLAKSLEGDLDRVNKLLKDENVGIMDRILGQAGTEDLQKLMGGNTGFGGFSGQIADIKERGNANIDAASSSKDPKAALKKAQDDLEAELKQAYAGVLKTLQGMLTTAQGIQSERAAAGLPDLVATSVIGPDQTRRIEQLMGLVRAVSTDEARIPSQFTNEQMKQHKDALDAADASSKQDHPFDSKIAELKAALADAERKLQAAGLDEASKMIARAEGDAITAIEHVNEGLKRQHEALINADPNKSAQGQQILDLTTKTEEAKAESARLDKVQEVTDRLKDQIATQQMLNAAIGKGWEAQKKVNVEVQLMHDFGPVAYNAAPDSATGQDVQAARTLALAAAEAKHAETIGLTVEKLSNEVAMQRALSEAQMLGAYAVERAAVVEQIRQDRTSAAESSAATEQEQWNKFYTSQANSAAAELAKIDQKIEATKRLTAAILEGADAVRKAKLQNDIDEARRQHPDQSIPGAVGVTVNPVVDALKRLAATTEQQRIADLAASNDRIGQINNEIADLEKAKAVSNDRLAIDIQINKLQKERIEQLVQESLDMGGVRDGMRAFFLEMQEQAEKTSQIMKTAFDSVVDETSTNLAKLMTGQGKKKQWADEFKEIGTKMLGDTIKSEMHAGLGALGKVFGIHAPSGKPDGSAANPFWVHVLNPCGGEASSPGGLSTLPPMSNATGPGSPGWGNGGLLGTGQVPKYSGFGQTLVNAIGGLFGGGGGGGGTGTDVSSSISYGGGMAAGGPVEPGSAYLISDSKDDEYFLPKSRGSIVPAGKGSGDGGTTIINNIDARNADLGAANRLHRVMEATRKQATVDAIQAQHERSKRVPQ